MRFRGFCRDICVAIAVALAVSVAYAAPVYVLQVEADGSTSNGYQYAPVNFAGSALPLIENGITYYPLSDPGSSTVSTYSSHAAIVRNRLLAADGPNNPVTDIWCLYAGDFLSNYVQIAPASTSANRPQAVGNNIKILNHSWVDSYGVTAEDLDAVRRMDYMIWREDLVMVSGAVSPWGTPSGPMPLTWASRNGIAVRGIQTLTPTDATGIGKLHADLWGPKAGAADDYSSYETPGVAGYAAALVDAAAVNGWSNGLNGLRHEVVKSVLMTGADKTAFTTTSGGFHSWTSNGVNNLDNLSGAGRADYATSLAVLSGGPQSMATVTGTTVNAPVVTSAAAGWWYADQQIAPLPANGVQALVVDHTSAALSDLTATLAWDVTQKEKSGDDLNTTDSGVIFANLNLELVPVTYNGATYTLGSSRGIAGLMSKSTDDNVEHLYFPDTLAAGYYAFVISNNSNFAWNYGFSYKFAATLVWSSTAGSAWESAGNWTGGASSPVAVDTAVFDGTGTALVVTPDSGRKVKNITFDTVSAGAYVIGTPGGNPLTLTSGGTIQTTSAVAALQNVNAPLVIAGTTAGNSGTYAFTSDATAGAATLNFGGGITGAAISGNTTVLTLNGANTGANTVSGVIGNGVGGGKLAVGKSGSGTWVLSGANTYTGATTVSAGTLQLGALAQAPIFNETLGEGRADIQGGKMVFDAGGPLTSTIPDLLTDSYNGGLWNTGRFLNSTAVATGLSLGWTDSGTQVTVMAAYAGDTNLDGEVDGADVDIWKLNVGTTGVGVWELADFNYDGEVDGADVDIWKLNAGSSLAPPPGGTGLSIGGTGLSIGGTGLSIVPEPGTLILLATGLLGLLCYAWRKRE
jgi:autotransporter-associated beta strand protein